jgi:hypothetical protein
MTHLEMLRHVANNAAVASRHMRDSLSSAEQLDNALRVAVVHAIAVCEGIEGMVMMRLAKEEDRATATTQEHKQ